MDDLEFARRCAKGDKQAWNKFVEKYSSLIYKYIHSVLKIKGYAFTQENIHDLYQEIFLSLVKDNFKKLRSYKALNGCSLASWLRQVTINSAIDYIRKSKPAISIDEETDNGFNLSDILPSSSPSASDTLSREEKFTHLKDCIDKLDTDDKFFLDLHIHRELSLEELRAYFKISRAAVDMRKLRIVERLRECFKAKGFVLSDEK